MTTTETLQPGPRRTPRGPRALRRLQRGQAMVEYSVITFFIALAGGASIITVLPMLMNALNRYLQGLYYMINLAVP